MTRRRRRSLRTRLTLITAGAVTATALLVCALAFAALSHTLLRQVDQELTALSRGPAGSIDPATIPGIPANPLDGPDLVRIQGRQPDGRTFAGPPGSTPLPFGAREQAVADGRSSSARYTLNSPQGRFRVLVIRGPDGATIQLARSLAGRDATLRQVGALMLALVLGAAMLAGLAGRLTATAGLAPVHRLTGAATRIADTQDLAHPIPVDGDDEVARLGQAFNRMLAALGRSRRAQRELIEDAAHELRTPMASLRTNVELLIHAGERLSGQDRTALLRDLDRQSVELSELVGDVVALARSAGVDETAAPLDLAEVASGAVARARARTPYARIALSARPVSVLGRAGALERALVNLLDNAVKFGPDDQLVEVGVSVDPDGYAVVTVADRAPGVPPEERERIFGRFHRLDASRSVPGSGLGLAIVAQTAAGHGGTATVRPRGGGGNVFTLRLPATNPGRAAVSRDDRR
ncbi:ATP-binding protein [Micromonospora sp. NPDC000089]|uniref:HAMP domain-containing sensor histidine kinase n=1 Tax=unclassified Micromonospora TaxID=2617518 RepID=UPI00369C02FF